MRSTRDLIETLALSIASLAVYTALVCLMAVVIWGIGHATDNTPWLRSYMNSVAVALALFAAVVLSSVTPDASRALRLNFRKQFMKGLK